MRELQVGRTVAGRAEAGIRGRRPRLQQTPAQPIVTIERPPLWVDTPTSRREIPAVTTEASREKFKSFLAGKGLRATNQRMAIFDAAFAQTGHFTAEELLVHARALDESASRATVYRTLPIMTGSAVLREIDIGKNIKYYAASRDNSTQQAQVICLDCDKIFEINAPFMEWYGSTVSSKLGLTPVSQRLQVSAHCNAFRDTGRCPHLGN
jgi:Fur family ferric uptake transcriptional regulator